VYLFARGCAHLTAGCPQDLPDYMVPHQKKGDHIYIQRHQNIKVT